MRLSMRVFSWVVLLLASGVALLTGASFFFDHVTSFPGPGDKLVEGVVVRRELITYPLGYKRPRLTVKIHGSSVLVRADLSMDGWDNIPDAVTFYYSGDPRREVHLLQEGNQLLGALTCWVMPFGVLTLLTWGLIRGSRSKTRLERADPYFEKTVVDELSTKRTEGK